MTKNTAINALIGAAQQNPDRFFANMPDGQTTDYDAFFAGARRVAMVISGLGISPGDRIAAQVESSPQAFQLYIGTLMAGGVILPLNPAYTNEETADVLTKAAPIALVCDPARVMDLMQVVAKAKIKSMMTLDIAGIGSLTAVADTLPDSFTPVARDPEDQAAVLYTPDTGDQPNMLSHGELLNNCTGLQDFLAVLRQT